MKNAVLIRNMALSAAVLSVLPSVPAFAHGPNVVLQDLNGQIVTNQLDVTPQNDSTNSKDYPIGAPGRVFPSDYDVANYNTFPTSAHAANQPTDMDVIPMQWQTYTSATNDSTGNSGFYGQLELTDANGTSTLHTGPGYAYGNGGFNTTIGSSVTGAILRINFDGPLQYWNTSSNSFTAAPDGEQLQAIQGTSFTAGTNVSGNSIVTNSSTTTAATYGTGLTLNTSNANPSTHTQFEYRLLESNGSSVDNPGLASNEVQPTSSEIADGIYLATFQVTTDVTSPDQLAPSLPYYMLFELDRAGYAATPTATEIAAVAAADSIAQSTVPEPTSLGLLALGGVTLLGRRKRLVE